MPHNSLGLLACITGILSIVSLSLALQPPFLGILVHLEAPWGGGVTVAQ